jgi:hypothetical protein
MQPVLEWKEGTPRGLALLRGLAAEDAGACADWLATSAFTHEHRAWLESQGLAPFAFYRLKQAGLLDRLPVAEQATLREAFIWTTAANLLALGEARAWAGRFAEAGITAVWLKGVPLSLTVYPAPGARPMGDIDVLLPREQVKPALALIQAVTGAPPAYLSADIEARVRLGPRSQGRMDVHWDLLPQMHLRRQADLDWFFSQQQTVVSEGVSLQALRPEAHLLYLCAHAEIAHRGALALRHHFDLHRLITQTPAFNWDIFVQQAAVLGWTQAVARGLAISVEAFGTPLPTDILTDLSKQRPAHESPLHTADHRILGNRWTCTIDYLGTLKWDARVRTAVALVFPPPAYMRWRYRLRRGWQVPFYYPYRWFDVVREMARARRREAVTAADALNPTPDG